MGDPGNDFPWRTFLAVYGVVMLALLALIWVVSQIPDWVS